MIWLPTRAEDLSWWPRRSLSSCVPIFLFDRWNWNDTAVLCARLVTWPTFFSSTERKQMSKYFPTQFLQSLHVHAAVEHYILRRPLCPAQTTLPCQPCHLTDRQNTLHRDVSSWFPGLCDFVLLSHVSRCCLPCGLISLNLRADEGRELLAK